MNEQMQDGGLGQQFLLETKKDFSWYTRCQLDSD